MALPKLLFYTHALVDGGAERLWSCLATALKHRGYDVSFTVDYDAKENAANLDASIPLTILGRNHGRSVRNLSQLLRATEPDVVLSAVGGSNFKMMTALALSRVRARSIMTYHGSVEPHSGWMAYFSFKSLPIISRHASRIVAVSEGLGEHLVDQWRAKPSKVDVILNPVYFPDNAPVPSASELAARDNVVLAVGRMSPEKDFTTLIRAFAQVRTANARLIILGKGPEREKLETEVLQLGLQDRVAMPGYSVEPWSHYMAAKCLVSPSQSELFGNAIVEAMAFGLPVVATSCVGPREIIRAQTHGTLVPIGDSTAMARAIEVALENPGDPAPRRVRADEFSFAARVPIYETLIEDVLFGRTQMTAQPSLALSRQRTE
jgi:glycosyltransferase involved in cell wall biosynthesis